MTIPESQVSEHTQATTPGSISPARRQQKSRKKELHYQLVFFDVVYLNGRSLVDSEPVLSTPPSRNVAERAAEEYAQRRKTLERVIRTIPGFTMLAERHSVDLKQSASEAINASLSRYWLQTPADKTIGST